MTILPSRDEVYSVLQKFLEPAHPKDFEIRRAYVQAQAISDALPLIEAGRNFQILAGTGTGKTEMIMPGIMFFERMLWPGRFPKTGNTTLICVPPVAVMPVTKALYGYWKILNTLVVPLPSMRASLGEAWLEWKTFIVNGEPIEYPVWKLDSPLCPQSIWVDESQKVKNDSQQSNVIQSAGISGIPIRLQSATPFSKPEQTKTTAICLKPVVSYGYNKGIELNEKIFPGWLAEICAPDHPSEWSPKAMRRIRDILEPYTIRCNVEFPFKMHVRKVGLRMRTEREWTIYKECFEEWQRLREAQGKNRLVGMAEVLVALQKFIKTSEHLMTPYLVEEAIRLYESKQRKISIIFAFVYRESEDIAIEMLKARGITNVSLVRGGVSGSARDKAVSDYQSDKNHFMILSIAAGGAALNLQHNRLNDRPRFMFSRICWNDLDLVQVAGRIHRADNHSPAYMCLCFFEGTEDVRQVSKVLYKMKALKEVLKEAKGKQSLHDFVDGFTRNEYHALKSIGKDYEENMAETLALIEDQGHSAIPEFVETD